MLAVAGFPAAVAEAQRLDEDEMFRRFSNAAVSRKFCWREGCCGAWVFESPLFISYVHSNNFRRLKVTRSVPYTILTNIFIKVRFRLCIDRRQRVRYRGNDWLCIQRSFYNNYDRRKHHKYRVLCTLSYQIKSWGRPHRFETSLTEPYVLSLQNFSSYQANLPNTGIQIIICFGMYYFVVGKYVCTECTELAYFLRKVRRRIRNTYLDHCMSII